MKPEEGSARAVPIAFKGRSATGNQILRLPYEPKDLFKDWLAQHYPLKAARIMSQIRQMRGGRENDPRFGAHARRGQIRRVAGKSFSPGLRALRLQPARTQPVGYDALQTTCVCGAAEPVLRARRVDTRACLCEHESGWREGDTNEAPVNIDAKHRGA